MDVEALLRSPRLALVVVDLMLPDGTGLDILSTLRKEERTKCLPVILCSAALFELSEIAAPCTIRTRAPEQALSHRDP